MPECQTWTAKVIVLIIFVFAIVFDNAVVGPWKPWSLLCWAGENLKGQRWDHSRTSSELQYIHKILSWLPTCREQSWPGQGYWTLWLDGMGWHPIAKLGFCHQQTGIQVSNWECTIKHCNLTIQNWELNMFEPAKNWSHPCKCRSHRQNRD